MKTEDEIRYDLDLLFEAYYECKRRMKEPGANKSSRKVYETLAPLFRERIHMVQYILEDEISCPIQPEPEWLGQQLIILGLEEE